MLSLALLIIYEQFYICVKNNLTINQNIYSISYLKKITKKLSNLLTFPFYQAIFYARIIN
ncbi:MAG: hypothetical protein APF84_15390 [Gracilibacter sp. BRH_c7a]|nr:MAG: hypothetical protein APF84_15390 [Gracilibacter sp. BRH_c7a]